MSEAIGVFDRSRDRPMGMGRSGGNGACRTADREDERLEFGKEARGIGVSGHDDRSGRDRSTGSVDHPLTRLGGRSFKRQSGRMCLKVETTA